MVVQGWLFCIMRRKGSHKIEDFVGKFDPDRKGDLSGSVRKMKKRFRRELSI